MFSEILQKFAQKSPTTVMVRVLLEGLLNPEKLDRWFENTRRIQYTCDILFSSLVGLMLQIVCKTQASVHAAYRHANLASSIVAVYAKLKGIELTTSQALVRYIAHDARVVIETMPAARPPLLPGLRVKYLDGNCLAASEHRLKPLRETAAGPLPGKSLVVFDPQLGLAVDVFPCADGHTQERALLDQVIATVQAADVWLADRNFCVTHFLFGIHRKQAFFIIREHGGTPGVRIEVASPWEDLCEDGASRTGGLGARWGDTSSRPYGLLPVCPPAGAARAAGTISEANIGEDLLGRAQRAHRGQDAAAQQRQRAAVGARDRHRAPTPSTAGAARRLARPTCRPRRAPPVQGGCSVRIGPWRRPRPCSCAKKRSGRCGRNPRTPPYPTPGASRRATGRAEAVTAGARRERACAVLGLNPRTRQRWRQEGALQADRRRREHRAAEAVRTPANRLSPAEQAEILTLANQPEFAHLCPHRIVPTLADQGRYLASESTFYRLLRAADQLARRGKPKACARARPAPLVATGPNRVWRWDIAYLATTVRGVCFYLYPIMAVYSRKIVGWEVSERECADYAASLLRKAHRREGVQAGALVLHCDSGSPMKGATMLATLHRLGMVPSFSRPAASNDNPYSQSLFGTLKGHPSFPDQPFPGLDDARTWVHRCARWYNTEHRHSALKFVTPDQRHRGEDTDLLAQRRALYRTAKAQHPERWSSATRNWQPKTTVFLNPGKPIEPKYQTNATTT